MKDSLNDHYKAYELTKAAITKLKTYLLNHESDIANDIDDYGDLKTIFFTHHGREASK